MESKEKMPYEIVNEGSYLILQFKDGTKIPMQKSLVILNEVNDAPITTVTVTLEFYIPTKDLEIKLPNT